MKILMVCLGNICRSPLAEGVLKKKTKEKNLNWFIDSAGTSSYHVGHKPDKRSIEIAGLNGIDISDQSARQFTHDDFSKFDLILAMDSNNYGDLVALAKNENEKTKIKLILNYLYPGLNKAVPDPYFKGNFDEVFELLDNACEKLIENTMPSRNKNEI